MKIGVLINFDTNDFEGKFKQVHDFGLSSCQLCCWHQELMTRENAERVKEYCKKYEINISTFWCGWSGPAVWDFYDGAVTGSCGISVQKNGGTETRLGFYKMDWRRKYSDACRIYAGEPDEQRI